jgi:hypothetical protein
MSRILVIANQTLRGNELKGAIEDRLAHGACEIVVAVPVTHAVDHVRVDQYGIQLPCGDGDLPADENEARSEARSRLDALLSEIRALGASASGVLGDADPWTTFRQLDVSRFDEVIVSTLEPSLSRWLKMDVVSRIDRTFEGPVSSVSVGLARRAERR